VAIRLLEDMTEPELAEVMNTAARAVTESLEDLGVAGPLFALLLFNDPRVANYISNCDRHGVILAMRNCADRMERNQDVRRN